MHSLTADTPSFFFCIAVCSSFVISIYNQQNYYIYMHIQAQMNKGKKMKGQQFTPGKGLRSREEEQEMLLSLSNPAQLGKGKSTGT